jgi:hypothetical protein
MSERQDLPHCKTGDWSALLTACKAVSLDHMARSVETYAEMNGGVHDEDCPCDDTCDCSFKVVNDGVNSACRFLRALAEGR